MEDFFSNDNVLIFASDEGRKGKKGDGINAILGLLQELRSFSDKIQSTADAQDLTENKQAVEAIAADLEKHSETLLDIVKGGIKSIRSKDIVPGVESEGIGVSAPPQSLTLPETPTPM